MTTRSTRMRFKPYVDNLRKKIVGWSIAKYLEAPQGIPTNTPAPVTKVSRRLFKNRKDTFMHKQGGWSISKSQESNMAPTYPD